MQPEPDANPPPTGGLLQLVYQGEFLPGFDRPTVRLAVERALHLDAAHSSHLFSGQRVIVSQGVSAEDAARYVEQFARMGAKLRMEPDPGPPDADIAPEPTAAARPQRRPAGALATLVAGALVLGVVVLLVRPQSASPPQSRAAAAPAPASVARAAESSAPSAPSTTSAPAALSPAAPAPSASRLSPEAALAECEARREPYGPPCSTADAASQR